jgi:hypothetical protein
MEGQPNGAQRRKPGAIGKKAACDGDTIALGPSGPPKQAALFRSGPVRYVGFLSGAE